MEWHNAEEPSKGMKYLYLSDADYRQLTTLSQTTIIKVWDAVSVSKLACQCLAQANLDC